MARGIAIECTKAASATDDINKYKNIHKMNKHYIKKSLKLANVCYDIRGPVLEIAKKMEEEGQKIIKLNIGNLASFGFDSPDEIQLDIIRNISNASGYTDSKGIFAARKAVMHYSQEKNIKGVDINDIYLKNLYLNEELE